MTELEQVLSRALALGDEGRWHEMSDLLLEALEAEPEDPYLLGWLGLAEREMGNEGTAYEYFRRCLAQDPADPHLLALAGSGLATFDDPDAEAALRAAALTGPDVPMARLQYGSYLAREGLFEEAMHHLHAALELAPQDPTVHGELGIALALKGELEAAAEELEAALDLAPDDAWTRLLLGLMYAELDMLEAAAEALIQAAEERGDDAEAHILAGLAAAVVGWDAAAQAALARAAYVASGSDVALMEEAEERLARGPEAARSMLLDDLGPSVLRERLTQPL
ncbi:MAG: tetratricopeptide repeat protein [Gemmatimonadetes bacterium]|nr:tetratricopeptide repeat protein [Gemmatimonadota bacterium]